jgi:hypothetical protein
VLHVPLEIIFKKVIRRGLLLTEDTSFAFPVVDTVTLKLANEVDAASVITARVGLTVILVWKKKYRKN